MYTMRDLCSTLFFPLRLRVCAFSWCWNLTISIWDSHCACALSIFRLIDYKMCNNSRFVRTSKCLFSWIACSNVKWTNLTQSSSNFQPLRQLFCQNGDELCPPTYTRTSMIEFKLNICIQTQSFDWRKILIFISIFFHSFFFTVCGSFYCSLTRHNFYESIVCDTTGDRQQMHEQQQKQQQEQQWTNKRNFEYKKRRRKKYLSCIWY